MPDLQIQAARRLNGGPEMVFTIVFTMLGGYKMRAHHHDIVLTSTTTNFPSFCLSLSHPKPLAGFNSYT